jgi:hypothetical protein
MKPRALKTYKILAVALAAAGCSKAVGPDPGSNPTAEPITQEAPAPVEAVNAPNAPASPPGHATELPSRVAVAEPSEGRPVSNDPALMGLRMELAMRGREHALANVAHFRPLCDKDGYPLVGNVVIGKGNNPVKYQPSAFCSEIRQQQKQALR